MDGILFTGPGQLRRNLTGSKGNAGPRGQKGQPGEVGPAGLVGPKGLLSFDTVFRAR